MDDRKDPGSLDDGGGLLLRLYLGKVVKVGLEIMYHFHRD